jgi:hypothetical protein
MIWSIPASLKPSLYPSQIQATKLLNHGYAEVTGNRGKFCFTPVVFVMPD